MSDIKSCSSTVMCKHCKQVVVYYVRLFSVKEYLKKVIKDAQSLNLPMLSYILIPKGTLQWHVSVHIDLHKGLYCTLLNHWKTEKCLWSYIRKYNSNIYNKVGGPVYVTDSWACSSIETKSKRTGLGNCSLAAKDRYQKVSHTISHLNWSFNIGIGRYVVKLCKIVAD